MLIAAWMVLTVGSHILLHSCSIHLKPGWTYTESGLLLSSHNKYMPFGFASTRDSQVYRRFRGKSSNPFHQNRKGSSTWGWHFRLWIIAANLSLIGHPHLSWCSRTIFGAPGINSPCLNCSSSSRSFSCSSRPRSVCWCLYQETSRQLVLALDCLQCKSWVKDRNKPREREHRKMMSEDWCVQCWAVLFLSFHQLKHLELFNVIFFLAVQHTDL